jgi:hypothetical protein
MIYRCLITLLVIAMVAGCATRDERNKPAAASASAATSSMPYPEYVAASYVPPMERDRKINEQDCRTGIDLLAGNLRCK